jgi:hypothetical protein
MVGFSASKSMFFNTMIPYSNKSVLNPVGIRTVTTTTVIDTGGGGTDITDDELASLREIEEFYTSNLAAKTYTQIPTDFTRYLKLFDIVNKAYIKYSSNTALALLFQITTEGLTGSMNAFGLNTLNVELEIQNTWYQEQLQQIINGINVNPAFDQNIGTLSMAQTFELAPLFTYYIKMYGVPAPGVGFDPVKLNIVLTALENMGIDPYG